MANEKDKNEQKARQERQRDLASQQQKSQGEPTAEDDRKQLNPDPKDLEVKVEKDPAEAEQNHADWLEGRDPNDVVEVDGQRETVEARMARNGLSAPEKQAGATTL